MQRLQALKKIALVITCLPQMEQGQSSDINSGIRSLETYKNIRNKTLPCYHYGGGNLKEIEIFTSSQSEIARPCLQILNYDLQPFLFHMKQQDFKTVSAS